MSERQWRKKSLVERIERGEVTVSEAAASLGLSRRQMQRIRKRLMVEGVEALVHGNTGREPCHKTSSEIQKRVLELRCGKYAGFNDQHFTEKLIEVEGIVLTRETVRRLLRADGVKSPRNRRSPRHRFRRPRRAQAGQMVLWDGSSHDWLEGRGPKLCLMGAIDDATGELLPDAHFTEHEGTLGYLRLLRGILREKGIPHTIYGDRHSSLKRNDKNWSLEEELAGRREPTHVRRALDDLGIEVIYALSAQAKGRVERLWATLQDRLVSELRLAGAKNRGQANRVLREYVVMHNRKFAVPASDSQPAWRKSPSDHLEILESCALQYVRKVNKNNTVRVHGSVVDIPNRGRSFAGKIVTVKQLLNGHIRVYHDGKRIAWVEGERPKTPGTGPRTQLGYEKQLRQKEERTQRQLEMNYEDEGDTFTVHLGGDIFTLL